MADSPVLRQYRHRSETCSRLLFKGYLPPGTHIRVQCPACGKMHHIDVPLSSHNGHNGNGHLNGETITFDIPK